MKLNNKGQALIEFILILPLFIMLIFIMIDFGVILNAKSSLENKSSDIIELYKNKKDIKLIESTYDDVSITVSVEGDYIKVVMTSYVDLITPGMNKILSNPYPIQVERIIAND